MLSDVAKHLVSVSTPNRKYMNRAKKHKSNVPKNMDFNNLRFLDF